MARRQIHRPRRKLRALALSIDDQGRAVFPWLVFFALLAALLLNSRAHAADVVQSFTFEGYATDNADNPISGNVDFTFQIYESSRTCLLYEETQTVAVPSSGAFAVEIGSVLGSPKRGANDPGISMNTVFSNGSSSAIVPFNATNCTIGGGFIPASGQGRALRITASVNGGVAEVLSDVVLNSVPMAMVAESVQGKKASDLIQVNGNLTQANSQILVGGGDVGALHHHDARYMSSSGNAGGQVISNIGAPVNPNDAVSLTYAQTNFSAIGHNHNALYSPIGHDHTGVYSPVGHDHNALYSPIGHNHNGVYAPIVHDHDAAYSAITHNHDASYLKLDGSNSMAGNLSLSSQTTLGLGVYTDAEEAAISGAAGKTWFNSTTNTMKYWDGVSAHTLSTSAGGVTSFNGRLGAVAPAANDYTWAQINKTTSSLADLTTRNAADLTGTLNAAQLPAVAVRTDVSNTFTVGGQQIQNDNAGQIPFFLQGAPGQTAKYFEVQNNGGTTLYTLNENGVPVDPEDLATVDWVNTVIGGKANAVHNHDADYINVSGDSMTGTLNMGGNTLDMSTGSITNLAAPVVAGSAANKGYVDANIAGQLATLGLGAGTNGQFLQWNNGLPGWQMASAVTSVAVGTGITNSGTAVAPNLSVNVGTGANQIPQLDAGGKINDVVLSNNVVRSNGSSTFSLAQTFNADVTFDTNTMFVDSTNHRVGIGLTNPTARLHVGGASPTLAVAGAANPTLSVNSTTGSDVYFELRQNTNQTLLVTAATDAMFDSTAAMRFSANGTADQLVIHQNGNVGIGTAAAPSGKLDVEGGYFYLPVPLSAPADGTLANSQITMWLNEATNNQVEIKAKRSDGTVVNRTLCTGIDCLTDAASDTTNKNLSIGSTAGSALAGGALNNLFVGERAGFSTTTGDSNVAIGYLALEDNVTGNYNTAVGHQALANSTGLGENTAFGYLTLLGTTSGQRNASYGTRSMQSNATGSDNAAFGSYALSGNITGNQNTAIGNYVLGGNNGSRNTGVGYNSLSQSTGSDNIAIGWEAGEDVSSGSNNILIGNNVQLPAPATSNHLNIGNILYGDLATGSVGIGAPSPGSKFYVTGGTVLFERSGTAAVQMLSRSGAGNSGNMLGSIGFSGFNSSAAQTDFAYIESLSTDFNAGTEDGAIRIYTRNNGAMTEAMRVVSGNVGIGVPAPTSRLEVDGAVRNAASISNATLTVNFALGNLQYTALQCQTFALHNLKDGGSYTFVVKNGTSATCSFNGFSDAGTTGLTMHLPPDHGPTIATKHTVYSIVVFGNDAYVSWVPGY